jgi:hypothetical protein
MNDYPVGYGRPPKHGQFQKGKSGNPKGRPRKQKSLRAILREVANETTTVTTKDGKTKKIIGLEWVVRSQFQMAVKGDNGAAARILQLWEIAFGLGPSGDSLGKLDDEARELLQQALKDMVDGNRT